VSKKWEYQIQSVPRVDDVIHALNKLGDEGWELIQLSGTTCYFKREKEVPKPKEEQEGEDEVHGMRQV